ncbi:MAG TPA: carbon-nitrogen hydrolase [Planctomycetota bacterium]|nr:carbon-nitrogen hydrolase [Planctomycetota bacterium]
MPAAPFKIGLVQMRCTSDAKRNLEAAEKGIVAAARRGARVVCLPELFRSLYFCQTEDHSQFELAEPVPGPTTKALGALARKLKVAIVGSVFERRALGLYHNTAVVIDADGSLAGVYRKMHIPDDPLYYEKFYFTPGDLGFKAFDTRYGRIGVLVCWDQWYPEAARLTALQGAVVLFYPTAIGWHPGEKKEWGESQTSAWQTMQRSHAIANGVYVAAVNRTGHEGAKGGGIEFFGASFVCDPYGRVTAQASRGKEEVLVAEVDPGTVETARRHWPFLRDRRVDAYAPITERHLEKR